MAATRPTMMFLGFFVLATVAQGLLVQHGMSLLRGQSNWGDVTITLISLLALLVALPAVVRIVYVATKARQR